jgi:F-type H+-transporting ATPase subunit c
MMETIYAAYLIAAAIIFGICGAGTAIAFGNLGGKLIESSARQPELAPRLQTQFFLVAAFVDVISIIGVGMAFLFIFAGPFTV